MYCLFNGEYGEHDLSWCPSIETNLRLQRENYEHYKGTVVGDFTCIEVEYDWGKRDQRWRVKCNRCGRERYVYHAKDWKRGKGGKRTCDYCMAQDIKAIRANHAKEVAEREKQRKDERLERLQQVKDEYIGKVFNGWEITDFISKGRCVIRCVSCGREIRSGESIKHLISGERNECKHPTDYSGEEWIGRRAGHLTVIGREGKFFIYKCDCGNTRKSSPSLAFRTKAITNCGKSDCPYMSDVRKGVATAKEIGEQYESDMLSRLLMQGYNAKTTNRTGDFGVDIIAIDSEGEKMAIQCKYHKSIVGVEAVQEAYAGGRFYDCTKFAVVSDSGFSNNAILMAKKLGVYLSNGNFKYPNNIQKYTAKLLPTFHERKRRLPPKELRSREIKYTIDGFTGTTKELCEHFDVSKQLLAYRIRNGMDLQTALTMPKSKRGRPNKAVE